MALLSTFLKIPKVRFANEHGKFENLVISLKRGAHFEYANKRDLRPLQKCKESYAIASFLSQSEDFHEIRHVRKPSCELGAARKMSTPLKRHAHFPLWNTF